MGGLRAPDGDEPEHLLLDLPEARRVGVVHVDGEVPDPVAALAAALEDVDDLLVLGIAAQVVVEDDLPVGGQHVELAAEGRTGHLVVDVVHASAAGEPLTAATSSSVL